MIHKYIYAGLGTLFLGLILTTFYFYKENKALSIEIALKQQQINNLQYQLKQQNEAIEKLALDTQEYKKQLTTQNKQWEKKYNTIVSKIDTTNATCEEQLTNINEQLEAFMIGKV